MTEKDKERALLEERRADLLQLLCQAANELKDIDTKLQPGKQEQETQ